ncbi:uncharacterized protein J3D65DRAFT_670906 [Phyllosticta citribraziliensis]|uniref:BTB domain-containing protein n=1 Tax=Phyllosticta citribraziliensis TaxID=989973 RepID=A0ABR1LAL9_9PEZI
MAPQRPTMSASIRGFGEEGFDRESLKTSRQNAPSFSNGLLRANELVAVVFPRHANRTIMCHADILRFWSSELRNLIDNGEASQQGSQQDNGSAAQPTQFSLTTITLRDVQPQTFAIFLDWAYSGNLPDTKPLLTTPSPADTDESESNASFYYRQPEAKFLEAYIFGRRYHIRDFRNDTFDCLYEIVNWRKVGKEGDPTGKLMPSLLVCYRAMSALHREDRMCDFFWYVFYLDLPGAIQSTREESCAIELQRYWGVPIGDHCKKGDVRDGSFFGQLVKQEKKTYCQSKHEHLGNEHAECWAHSMANDSAGSIDEEKDSDTDGANSKMDEDTEEEKGDADVSMDENDEVEKGTHEQEPPNLKAFSVWGCDESASEDWDRDYENSSQGYDSDELKEGEDEGEEEGGDVVSELVSMALVDVEGPHIGGTDTGSEAERYQYAW